MQCSPGSLDSEFVNSALAVGRQFKNLRQQGQCVAKSIITVTLLV